MDSVISRDESSWNEYWSGHETGRRRLYDAVASFYREYLIRPLLDRFARKVFLPGARLLHAGCGGGQVDKNLALRYRVSAADISPKALELYRRNNPGVFETTRSSIHRLGFADRTFDGIYNLGVMEHFLPGQLDEILAEFHRVLKDDGKLLIFWPPRFGSSVLFLKTLEKILSWIRRKTVVLYPEDPSNIASREEAGQILERSGFGMADFYFGWRDFFTYTVITAKKGRRSMGFFTEAAGPSLFDDEKS